MRLSGVVCAGVLLCACGLYGDDDAENCKDSPIISRVQGGSIHSCDHKEFEQLKVRVGTNKDGEAIEKPSKASIGIGTTAPVRA